MATIVSRLDSNKILWQDSARENLSEADLSKANLSEADLSKANLSWANLSEADLSGANLSEANLSEAKILDQFRKEVTISHLITQIDRKNDRYRFHAFKLTCGGILIKAGCRTFNTTDAYRDHVQREYSGTTKAAETLAILSFIDTVSEI